MTRKIILLVFIVFLGELAKAQLLEKKLNVSVGYITGNYLGYHFTSENSFKTPALFSNYNSLNGFLLKSFINVNRFFSLGAGYSYSLSSEWSYQQYSDYTNSRFYQNAFSPILKFHTQSTEKGLLNRVRLFVSIAPEIGFSKLILQNPIFEIHSNGSVFSGPLISQNLFLGLKSTAGIELSVNQTFGIFASYSFQQIFSKSVLYSDMKNSTSLFESGIFIRVKKAKLLF